MEAIYFFAGIAVLLAANYLAIRRIDAKSYLRPPNSRIKEFWIQSREEQTSKPTSKPPLSRPELREQKYVEWFTQGLTEIQRAEKARKIEAAQRKYEDEHPAFVGVAIVHEEEPAIKDSKHKPEKNIDRWYRTAANG
ncbi:MAG: hypothetical protein V2I48_01045 [Xanthomonadales bacterium]|jgi:hypothetical protein|nr:hypothetical protein [Xanthomonadales bacterium]